jgi:signal transduction histidine kinase
VIGKGINDFVHPAFIGTAKMSQDLKELEGMKPLISEEKFIRLDKKVIDVEVSSAPIMYQGIPAALVFVRDITRRKKAEEQLRQSATDLADKNAELDFLTNQLLDMNEELDNRVKERTEQVFRVMKQKDEVITQIGHDLKTPLTPLRALLPYLIEVEQNSESKESLKVLLRSVHSIQEQTEKILTIARLSREDIAIRPELIRVLPIIRESVQKNWLFIERKKIQVEITVPEDLEVYFSHADATTVFDNVIGNSAKYSLEEGKITVSVRPDGEHVCIMVTDDGIGLSPDEAEHVFDEFYMADSSRHDRYSSGLGLSIVRRIVHLYGGKVDVESEGKGKGSTFILCFPKNGHLTEKMDSL